MLDHGEVSNGAPRRRIRPASHAQYMLEAMYRDAQVRSTAAYLCDQAAEKLNAQQTATAKRRIADRKMAAAY